MSLSNIFIVGVVDDGSREKSDNEGFESSVGSADGPESERGLGCRERGPGGPPTDPVFT